jgi:U6 snRNA-associated Sm-like protein LSm2
VTIELKNDLCITGTLKSVDQFLNIKLDEIRVKDEQRYPHLVCPHRVSPPSSECVLTNQAAVKNVFIRGSVVRYVHLPANAVDTALLEDATRREAANAAGAKGR